MNITYHEQLYRSVPLMKRLRDTPITVCGAGALGANIVENLARAGCGQLSVIDRDRVEERNLSTQPYQLDDVGAQKAVTLANAVYRAVGCEVKAVARELTSGNVAKLLKGAEIVVDAFDNSVAREAVTRHCAESGVHCLHAGLASDYAEVLWNEVYCVPSPAQDDICDYPLARNLVLLTVAITCESLIGFLDDSSQGNFTITLRDLCVRPYTA